MNFKNKKRILITVGTTEFEELIQYTDSDQFLKLIEQIDQKQFVQGKLTFKGFDILSQIGAKGLYLPKQVNYIRLSDRISQIYNESDFIICHGGAGTLLQNLRNGKKIIAVANDTLAGNHQVELINKLAKQGYLLGFQSVKELKKQPEKMKEFLSGKTKFKQYEKVTKPILNDIIFGQN